MKSISSIAVYAKFVFARHARVLAVSVGVVCTALLPGPLRGQTWSACTNNSSFICAPSGINVGVGTLTALNPFHAHVETNQNLGIRSHYGMTSIGTFNDAGSAAVSLNLDATSCVVPDERRGDGVAGWAGA